MDYQLYPLPLQQDQVWASCFEAHKSYSDTATAEDMRRCDHGYHPSQSSQCSCISWEEGLREPDLIPGTALPCLPGGKAYLAICYRSEEVRSSQGISDVSLLD